METWEVLERAADEMERRGKCEGAYMTQNAKVCAIGAMTIGAGNVLTPFEQNAAFDFVVNMHPALTALEAFLGPHTCTARWNDSNDAPTVIAGLRAVAATLRAQQATEPAAEPAKVTA